MCTPMVFCQVQNDIYTLRQRNNYIQSVSEFIAKIKQHIFKRHFHSEAKSKSFNTIYHIKADVLWNIMLYSFYRFDKIFFELRQVKQKEQQIFKRDFHNEVLFKSLKT